MSRRRRELTHQQVEQGNPLPAEPKARAQEEEVAAELVHSSGIEFEMVTRRVMSISCFVPGRRHPNNNSLPQLKLNLPLLLLPRVASTKRLARSSKPNLARVMHRQEPLPNNLGESQSGNPLLPPKMWHPFPRPPRQPSFMLDGKPFPSTACIRVWEKGEG